CAARCPVRGPPSSWAVLVADVNPAPSAEMPSIVTAISSGTAPGDPILRHPGGIGLRWAADDTLVFLSYRDGWPRLSSLQHPGGGSPSTSLGTGRPTLLTPGAFMV